MDGPASMLVIPDDSRHFGEHVMIDAYGCAREKLDDPDRLRHCLTELPGLLAMRRLCDPAVYFAPGGTPKDPGGWTGFVVVQESHISIHTFPATGFVSIDVYTCKNGLDAAAIAQYFTTAFGAAELETQFAKRGVRYPDLVSTGPAES